MGHNQSVIHLSMPLPPCHCPIPGISPWKQHFHISKYLHTTNTYYSCDDRYVRQRRGGRFIHHRRGRARTKSRIVCESSKTTLWLWPMGHLARSVSPSLSIFSKVFKNKQTKQSLRENNREFELSKRTTLQTTTMNPT